jgi:hypothetical protein
LPRDNGTSLTSRAAAVALPALVFLIAFVLRLLHLHEMQQDILFQHPVLDEEMYYRAAKALAAGEHLPCLTGGPRSHLRSGGLDSSFRRGPPGSPCRPGLLSAGSCLLVYLLARRFLSRTQALAAAAIQPCTAWSSTPPGKLKKRNLGTQPEPPGAPALGRRFPPAQHLAALFAGRAVFGVSALFRLDHPGLRPRPSCGWVGEFANGEVGS